jgi:hypothetical protein
MIIQWYKKEAMARIFYGEGSLFAELPGCRDIEQADTALLLFRVRRRERWEKVSWGYQAKLRMR